MQSTAIRPARPNVPSILVLVYGALLLSFGPPLQATTFVMVPDAGLVDRSTAIVTVRILDQEPAPPSSGLPWTDYRVEVDRALKGTVGGTLIVRVPGGERPDGVTAVMFGAPHFEPGDEALLFLDAAADGTWRVRHLMLGAFHIVRGANDGPKAGNAPGAPAWATRNLVGTREVRAPSRRDEKGSTEDRGPRSLSAFLSWIGDRVRGEIREPDYFLSAGSAILEKAVDGLRARTDPFTLILVDERRIRWFDFDRDEPVVWQALRPQPGLSTAQRRRALQRGLEIWNGIGATNIRLELGDEAGGTPTGFAGPDGVNTILFDDPNQTFDPQGFDCEAEIGGGPLAAAFAWASPEERPYRGRPHRVIFEADVVFNRNLACYFERIPNPQGTADAVVGHEIGHTLGFGHSSQDDPEPDPVLRDALMYFRARADLGRDVQVNADDQAAARTLYGTGPPAAPSGLSAEAVTETEVRLTWTDNALDEDSYRVERAEDDGPFVQIVGFLPRDSESVTIGELVPGTRYQFRVRARNAAGFSGYSNVTETTPGRLEPPVGLRILGLGERRVDLGWIPRGRGEAGFRVEIRSPAGPLGPRDAPPGAEGLSVDGLDPETSYTFRVRAVRGVLASDPGAETSATTLAVGGAAGPCVPGERTLCLLGDRFRVRVTWRDPRSGDHGFGRVAAGLGSEVSGLFWFFDASNLELIVKLIDGVGLNGFYWTFYGGLSDVEHWIEVVDSETGESVTYHNPPGEICGLADVRSFPREAPALALPASVSGSRSPDIPIPGSLSSGDLSPTGRLASRLATAQVSGSCVPGPTTLCLLDGRFQVEVEWENPRPPGDRGVGTVVPTAGAEVSAGEDSTGIFWFFTPENLELVVKVLDGRVVNGRFWVFYGALTDVGYRITVTDTVGDVARTYENEPFNLCGDADVQAF